MSLKPDNPWFEIDSSRNNNLAGLLPDAATLGAMNYMIFIFLENQFLFNFYNSLFENN